jgi:hypothetical protein
VDTGRQVLRFSIPGSIAVLYAAGLILVGRLAQGDSLHTVTDAVDKNVAGLVVLLASIPLGFLIYQIYYASYKPFVWLWLISRAPDGWIRLDRGSQILSVFSSQQIEALEEVFGVTLDITKPHRRAQRGLARVVPLLELSNAYRAQFESPARAAEQYRSRWYQNWDVLRALVDICESTEATRGIKREYTTLSDLYHALGASRTALWVAWVASTIVTLIYVANGHGNLETGLLSVVGGLVLTSAGLVVLHQTRRQTWMSAQASLKFGLLWIFDNHPQLLSGEDESWLRSQLRRRARPVT